MVKREQGMKDVDAVLGFGPNSWIISSLISSMNLTAPITIGMNIGEPYTNNTYMDIDNIDSNLNMSTVVYMAALKRNYWATNISGFRFGPPSKNMSFGE